MTDQPAAGPEPTAPAPDSEETKSLRVTLADICARGAAAYTHKRYEDAAESYARAAEMQAELNGEMDASNAEILFLYGRSLFKVGQGKSDVLGGKAAGAEKEAGEKKKGKGKGVEKRGVGEVEKEGEKKEAGKKEGEGEVSEEKKPLFQFTGDENWDDTDEEEDEQEQEQEEEEDDDLATAFGVLDLARLLFSRRLEQLQASGDEHDAPTVRHVRERLADTHDLLSEISLENESYPAAISDARASLTHKKALHPPESEVLAEAHFKLSLALEYASITTTAEEAGAGGGSGVKGESVVDQAQRDEACAELQAAVDSTRLKLGKKEGELSGEEGEERIKSDIEELKGLIADMEERLNDLRGPPIDLNETLFGKSGLLGAAAAGAPSSSIQDAKKNATDLSSLVRKKGRDEGGSSNGKRKAEEGGDGGGEGAGGESPKKAKVEDA